ncbi:hypothetical protein F4821DRAFT_248048 [Hypoxylon rubiginosum]|uniref:Uncharacterized protein n=1 Tax=Hypoxylon rubiginosum TaxID=110542 RepID=A0ACC0CNR5_9PEZI|nr:hypothetical protein F4821DRAFT_248048 [Hypoxylon rubiginosum]
MYGIIAFDRGDGAPSAEFRAGPGRYGRGSACKQCRISRVRCSGTLDGENCRRCKRLAKHCSYISKQTQRNHDGRQSPGSNDKSVTSPRAASAEPVNPDSPLPCATSSSPSNLASCNEAQPVTSNSLELDFEGWLHDTSLGSEFLQPNIDLVATSPRTGMLDPPYFPSLQLEDSQGNGEACDNLAPLFPGLTDGGAKDENMVGYEPGASQLDPQDSKSDGRGSSCQCNCLKALTSSLSFLRGWTWGERAGVDSGIRAGGVALNCAEVEDFLALFEKSMAQLRTAESCPMACILSQDLAILLLVVLEQLAKLLLSLAEDSTGISGGSPLDIPSRLTPHSIGVQGIESSSTQQGQGIRLARVGTFEITDPFDLQMIMKVLLQIRTQALGAYVRRLSDKVKSYGFDNLEADLKRITENLDGAVLAR